MRQLAGPIFHDILWDLMHKGYSCQVLSCKSLHLRCSSEFLLVAPLPMAPQLSFLAPLNLDICITLLWLCFHPEPVRYTPSLYFN
jgi:hypothetical protein